jgi:hypothetical protein
MPKTNTINKPWNEGVGMLSSSGCEVKEQGVVLLERIGKDLPFPVDKRNDEAPVLLFHPAPVEKFFDCRGVLECDAAVVRDAGEAEVPHI